MARGIRTSNKDVAETADYDPTGDEFVEMYRRYTDYRNDISIRLSKDFLWRQIGIPEGGESTPTMWSALRQAEQLSNIDTPIFIEGPAGSDKLPLCYAIHTAGKRLDSEIVPVSCAGTNVLTFVNAVQRTGTFGTLLVTEVDRADPKTRDRLYGLLRGRSTNRPRHVYILSDSDTGVLSQIDPRFACAVGYRERIVVPPLKQHRWDIIPAALTVLRGVDKQQYIKYISYAAALFLTNHDWGGDLRELRETTGAAAEAVIRHGTDTLTLQTFIDYFRELSGTTVHDLPAEYLRGSFDRLPPDERWKICRRSLGSEVMGRFFVELRDRGGFIRMDSETKGKVSQHREDERDNGPRTLSTSDILLDLFVVLLRDDELMLNRKWFAKLPKGSETLTERTTDDHGDTTRDCPVLTFRDAENVYRYSIEKMRKELSPFMQHARGEAVRFQSQKPKTKPRIVRRDEMSVRNLKIYDDIVILTKFFGGHGHQNQAVRLVMAYHKLQKKRVLQIFRNLKKQTSGRVPDAKAVIRRYTPPLTPQNATELLDIFHQNAH